MNNSRFDKESSKTGKNKKRFSKLTSLIVLGAIVAAVIALAMSPTSIGVRGAASKAQSFLNMISSEQCN